MVDGRFRNLYNMVPVQESELAPLSDHNLSAHKSFHRASQYNTLLGTQATVHRSATKQPHGVGKHYINEKQVIYYPKVSIFPIPSVSSTCSPEFCILELAAMKSQQGN